MEIGVPQFVEEGEQDKGPSFAQLSVDVPALVKRLISAKPGELLTYASLNAAVPDRNLLKAHRYYLLSARRVAERDHKVVFACVRGTGLRRLTGEELVDSWQHAAKRVRRIVRGAVRKLGCADYDTLSNDKQVQLNAELACCSAIDQFTKPSAVRQIERMTAIAKKCLSFHETLAQFKE